MSKESEPIGTKEGFEEAANNLFQANEDMSEERHPFLRTAVSGLTARLNDEFSPDGLVLATELYIADAERVMGSRKSLCHTQ